MRLYVIPINHFFCDDSLPRHISVLGRVLWLEICLATCTPLLGQMTFCTESHPKDKFMLCFAVGCPCGVWWRGLPTSGTYRVAWKGWSVHLNRIWWLNYWRHMVNYLKLFHFWFCLSDKTFLLYPSAMWFHSYTSPISCLSRVSND